MRTIGFVFVTVALAGMVLVFTAGTGETKQMKDEATDQPGTVNQTESTTSPQTSKEPGEKMKDEAKLQLATFGSGCFWCTEAIFEEVKGVTKVVSGYSGGHVKNPTYEQVCDKTTGHAEVVQITYNPEVISYPELLEIFWRTHDPTTKDRQGADVGPQYRSAIFYHTPEQKEFAEKYKKELDESGAFPKKIVTEISEFKEFYPAENYHQNFFNLNPEQGYCQFVIGPKMEKFRKVFQEKLKSAE